MYRCYHTYTKFLSNDICATFENVYQQYYNLFCKEVIKEKTLRKHKVYYLTKLCDKFLSCMSNKHASTSIYSTSKLKVKLRRDYPHFSLPVKKTKVSLSMVNIAKLVRCKNRHFHSLVREKSLEGSVAHVS